MFIYLRGYCTGKMNTENRVNVDVETRDSTNKAHEVTLSTSETTVTVYERDSIYTEKCACVGTVCSITTEDHENGVCVTFHVQMAEDELGTITKLPPEHLLDCLTDDCFLSH